MKKALKLFWHILIFPMLYIPYLILNGAVIVKWLGCGCHPHFNANDFTLLFWSIVALIIIVISIIKMRYIKNWYNRVLYIVLLSSCSAFLTFLFYASMMWK